MKTPLGPVTGVTSIVFCLSLLAPTSLARPSVGSKNSIRQSGAEPKYHEHKYQRIYRNDDPFPYVESEEPAKSKRAAAGALSINSVKFLGASHEEAANMFIDMPAEPLPTLSSSQYQAKGATVLCSSGQYSAPYNGSGSLVLDSQTQPYLKKMTATPRLSRDGGLGGKINGRNLFIFADTETYTTSGAWTGFYSNSVASNGGFQRKNGEPPIMRDKLGEFSSSKGSLRNFIPFTQGEAAFNAKMAGQGQRYAIWPVSSLIPIDSESSLLFAPIIFTNSDVSPPSIGSIGMTVAKITVPSRGGAVAERLNPFLFPTNPGVEWGGIGGIRGHGPYGTDGTKVYVFGNHKSGLMLGRVDVEQVGNPNAYQFWKKGGTWTSTRPGADSTDNFVDGAYSNVDIFYSPHHSTFIMVFMTPYTDNKFYWRYLQAPQPIKPSATDAFIENITKHSWSAPKELLHIPDVVAGKYAYAGGVHRGYFGEQDITSGGTKMLLSWTNPTGKAASSPETGYQLKTAEVTFN